MTHAETSPEFPEKARTTPLLRVGRFELWQPTAGDHQALHGLTLDPAMRRFLGQHEPDPADSFARLFRNAGSWALHGYGTFMVREVGQPELVAHCGVFRSWRGLPGLNDVAEAGWIVSQAWWGQGVATEIMQTVLEWFDRTHGRQRIACMIDQGNAGSERVAARLGFVRYLEHRREDGTLANLYERLP